MAQSATRAARRQPESLAKLSARRSQYRILERTPAWRSSVQPHPHFEPSQLLNAAGDRYHQGHEDRGAGPEAERRGNRTYSRRAASDSRASRKCCAPVVHCVAGDSSRLRARRRCSARGWPVTAWNTRSIPRESRRPCGRRPRPGWAGHTSGRGQVMVAELALEQAGEIQLGWPYRLVAALRRNPAEEEDRAGHPQRFGLVGHAALRNRLPYRVPPGRPAIGGPHQ